MKRIMILFTVLSLPFMTLGQQRPQYTQYTVNNYILNPAITGIESYMDVKLAHRKQWDGFNEGPVTSYFSFHTPIGLQPDYYGNNPMNRSFVGSYRAPEPHHGIGMYAVFDKPGGPLSTLDVNLTYAYHLGLSSRMTLSMGVAAGVSRMTLDMSEVKLGDQYDPGISSGSKLNPDLGAGVWLYGPTYFAGVSAQGLLGRPLGISGTNNANAGKQAAHFFITSGYKIFVNEDIAVIPSVMVKYVSPSPISFDLNTRLAFKENKFWVGGSYRKDDSAAAMAGFNVSSLFNVSYSYDFVNSSVRRISSGSHEIVLGFLLNNRYKVTCPQENW